MTKSASMRGFTNRNIALNGTCLLTILQRDRISTMVIGCSFHYKIPRDVCFSCEAGEVWK